VIRALALGALLTGCVIEEKVEGPDLACAGQPLPATAPRSVTVDGFVQNLQGGTALADVTIEPFSSGLPLAVTSSSAAGTFSYTHETGGVPNNDFVKATKTGFLDTFSFPGAPIAGDDHIEVRMVTMAEVMAFNDQIPIDLTKGIIFMRLVDCNQSPVQGATVSSSPAGTIAYFQQGQPSAATQTDPSGIVMILNLPPGEVTLTGSLGTVPLRASSLTPTPGAFVITQLQP